MSSTATATPKSAKSSHKSSPVTESGLIPQGVANKMQADAHADPATTPATGAGPANPVLKVRPPISTTDNAAAADSESAEDGDQSEVNTSAAGNAVMETAGLTNFNKLTCCLMITLNIADPRFLEGQAKPLSKSKDASGRTVNLYSPFRKAKDEKGIAAGVFRPLLSRAMKVLSTINDANIVIAGKQTDIALTLKNSVAAARAEVENLFPKFASDETAVDGICVSDVFRTTSWVNMSHPNMEEGDGIAIADHSGVVNFVINSGSVYDDADRIKLIRQLEATLQLLGTKYASVPILLALAFAGEDVEFSEIRELFTMLLDEDMYDVFSRTKLVRSLSSPEEQQDWIPQSQASIGRDLMPVNTDLLFVKVIGADEEDGEEGDGEEAAE